MARKKKPIQTPKLQPQPKALDPARTWKTYGGKGGTNLHTRTIAPIHLPNPSPTPLFKPDQFFGMHLNSPTIAWPTLPLTTQRLWDSVTSWSELQPTSAPPIWTNLDRHIDRAQSQNSSLLYTFGRTPQWAATNPTETCAYGDGQCSPPLDWQTWEDFVTEVVTRYKGIITAYELWNEPDNLNPIYWAGTDAQLLELCSRASTIIRNLDPRSTILSPGFINSNGAVNFIELGGASLVDVISIHGYLFVAFEQNLLSRINFTKNSLTTAGFPTMPVWMTEWSWGQESTQPDRTLQAQYLAKTLTQFFGMKIPRTYWYGWDFIPWGTLHDANGDRLAAHYYRDIATRLTDTTPLSFTITNGIAKMTYLSRSSETHRATWNVNESTFPFWE